MNTKRFIPKRREDKTALVLSVFFLILYLSTMSISLEEEDSAHFALALTDFNITKYQPHPPGFPVYIGLGKIFYSFTGNEVLALTSMSAFFGALSFLAVYVLLREFMKRETALAASVLTAVTPLFWLNSLKAMSDMTALLFIIVDIIIINRYIIRGRPVIFYAASLIAGISIGVRIHAVFILLPALVYAAWTRKNDVRRNAVGIVILAASIASWLVPLLIITGPGDYMDAAMGQLGYRVGRADISIIDSGLTPVTIAQRMAAFIYYFLLGGYGINLGGLGLLSIALLAMIVGTIVLYVRKFRFGNGTRLVISSLAVYVPAMLILVPPSNPRYFIILVPFLSALISVTLWRFKGKAKYAALAAFLVLALSHSVFLAAVISTTPAPFFQMGTYINENYNDNDIVLVSGSDEKYFSYYSLKPKMVRGELADCGIIEDLLSNGITVLSTLEGENCDNLKLSKVAEFTRDARVHVKRSNVELYSITVE